MKESTPIVKVKMFLFSVIGLILGFFLNRFTAFLVSNQTTGIQKILGSLTDAVDSISTKPLAFSFQLYPLLAFGFGLFLALLFFMLSVGDGKYRQGKEYGSARWATKNELKGFASKKEDENIILSKDIEMSLPTKNMDFKYQRNKNILLVAGSGAGKTEMFVKPNLSQFHSSYVVTDPKGKLLHETGKMMSDNGYQIKTFDVNTFKNCNRFNPFKYIHDEITLKRVIQAIIDATNGENSRKGEPFWDKSEELLLGSLFSFLYYKFKGDERKGIEGI